MVGVKGKYKGCNTCRKRRVACDNTRPFCKKCTDHGRPCEGYQTETVFIVGTLEDKGRCASHPPRNLHSSSNDSSTPTSGKKKVASVDSLSLSPEPAKSRRRAASEGQQNDTKLEFTEIIPAASSWDGSINIASVAGLHRLKFAALHTKLGHVRRHHERLGDWESRLTLPASKRCDVTPTFSDHDFKMAAECFVFLPRSSPQLNLSEGWPDPSVEEEGICLFLYEQTASAAYSNKPPWKDPAILADPIRRLGPDAFRTFPGHHFFSRVYRPNAVFAALLNHNPTFLADPEWKSVPWELSPKASLDNLIDIITQLPALLSRTDRTVALPASVGRGLKAKDILASCCAIEAQFMEWYAVIEAAAAKNLRCPLLYWPLQNTGPGSRQGEQGQIPFQVTYEFPSAEGGLSHIYYWTGLIVLYGIISRLMDVVSMDTGGNTAGPSVLTIPQPILPTNLLVTPSNITNPAYLRHRPPGYLYGSPMASPTNFTSVSAEELSATTSTAAHPTPYYQPSSPSPLQASASPLSNHSTISADELLPTFDSTRYGPRQIRRLAANVCRSLDWAIGRSQLHGLGPLGQPDLVAAPLYLVEKFYESIRSAGDGELERLWCVGFRERWEGRGRDIQAVIIGSQDDGGSLVATGSPMSGSGPGDFGALRSWIEVGKFGM